MIITALKSLLITDFNWKIYFLRSVTFVFITCDEHGPTDRQTNRCFLLSHLYIACSGSLQLLVQTDIGGVECNFCCSDMAIRLYGYPKIEFCDYTTEYMYIISPSPLPYAYS